VTAVLADLVPRGRIYAVDVAPSMAEHTRQALGDRATVLCQDLVELDLPEPVDVIFSNATFHWVLDHAALFAALHRALKPDGRLIAQCGGLGNIDDFRTTADALAQEEPYRPYFADWRRPWNYAGAEETGERLRTAGFTDVHTWLEPKTVVPADGPAFARSVCLVRHLDPLPVDLREPFVSEVLRRVGEPLTLAYVRLNMTATRA
jgi:trans-aconitate 2-methyltransferase